MVKTSKLRREPLDNFRDMLANSAKRIRGMETFDWAASIGERYRNHNLRFHVHIIGVGGLSEHCAIFEYFPLFPPENEFATVNIAPGADDRPTYPLGSHDLNEPVLVRVVEFFEPDEGVITAATPALVWLQPLNECLMFRSKVANHEPPVTSSLGESSILFSRELELARRFIAEGFGGSPNQKYWELGEACICVGFQQRQLVDQPIEGRTEVVSNLTDANAPIEGWSAAIYADAIATVSSLRIQLRPDNLIIGFERVGFANQFESLDFTFCTPYLEARAIQRLAHNNCRRII